MMWWSWSRRRVFSPLPSVMVAILKMLFFIAYILSVNHAFDDCVRPMRNGGRFNLLWIHIPKTGSSFSLPLMHQCCPTSFEHVSESYVEGSYRMEHGIVHVPNLPPHPCVDFTFSGHDPLCPQDAAADAVTVLRHPLARIVSSFEDSLHHEGMDQEIFRLLETTPITNESMHVENIIANIPQNLRSEVPETHIRSALRYFSHPSMTSCQTKMLTGHQCYKDVTVTEQMLSSAINSLERMQFVGVFEDWNSTIDCFHRMRRSLYNSDVDHPVSLDYLHTREGRYGPKEFKLEELVLREIGYNDAFDLQLYEVARSLYASVCLSGNPITPPRKPASDGSILDTIGREAAAAATTDNRNVQADQRNKDAVKDQQQQQQQQHRDSQKFKQDQAAQKHKHKHDIILYDSTKRSNP